MKRILVGLVAVGVGFWISIGSLAIGQTPPVSGRNYYSAQFPERPPLPVNMLGFPEAEISPGVFLLDDLSFNYAEFEQQSMFLNALESSASEPPPLPGEGQPGTGGTNWVDSSTARTFVGSCTGHLLTPVYQVTNLVLSLTGTTSGDKYDLYTATNLSVTNWTYLGRWTNLTSPWIITNPATNESYYFVGCVEDADGEGLPDVYEAAVTRTDMNDPDTDYDGRSDYEELLEATLPLNNTSFTATRLGYFRFNDGSFSGERGQLPLVTNALQSVDAWINKSVQLTNGTAVLKYRTVEADGKANINLRSGTLRFWFKPLWNSGTGTGAAGNLIEVGSRGAATTNGWWSLFFDSMGNTLTFVSQTNNTAEVTNLTAGVAFTSNRWCQLVLTYTNGAVALYTNGALCATNSAGVPYPPLASRTNGFAIGCATDGDGVAKGVFEDLETFNYPLMAHDVLEDFQLARPPSFIADLRLWLRADSIAQTNLGRISQWNDQSGSGNNVFQATLNTQPLLAAGGIGGKPSVYYAGSNYFNIPATTFATVTQAEAFVVSQVTADPPAANRGLWYIGGTGAGSRYLNASGTLDDGFGSAGIVNTGDPVPLLELPHIYNALAVGTRWENRINGIVHFAKNDNVARFDSGTYWLGNGASGPMFDGMMSEVLVYSRALDGLERFAVSAYLSQRFSFVTNLPTTPTNFEVFAVSSNQASLTWSSEFSNTNLSFAVKRRTASTAFTRIAFLENGQSFLDSGLSPGTTYFYRVKAQNFAGASAYTHELSVTTATDLTTMPLESLRVWLKADSGHGVDAVNCWVDQSTNQNHAYHQYNDAPRQPVWEAAAMNGRPAIYFQGTNAFRLPVFTIGWTQGEAFLVVKSLGSTASNWVGLWLMGAGSYASYYPYTNATIWENFGRTNGAITTGVSPAALSNPHLYNVFSQSGLWQNRINNQLLFSTNVNTVGFQESGPPRLGWGADSTYFRGYFSELMIFNRTLTTAERECVATNYLRRRFELW